MYGKQISKPLRKLGHVNLVGNNGETLEKILEKLELIKKKISVQQG